jgi:hypothetical protein
VGGVQVQVPSGQNIWFENFTKVSLANDGKDAFAFAGDVHLHGKWVPEVKDGLGGFDADELITRRLLELGEHGGFPELDASGVMRSQVLHAYRSGERFILCTQAVSRADFFRMFARSSAEGIKHVVLGDGADVFQFLFMSPPLAARWQALANRTDALNETYAFFLSCFLGVTAILPSVGKEIQSWIMTPDSPQWRTFTQDRLTLGP